MKNIYKHTHNLLNTKKNNAIGVLCPLVECYRHLTNGYFVLNI